MFPMPINVSQQLVADRQARHQATAARFRMRRLFGRSSADETVVEAPVVEAPVVTPVAAPISLDERRPAEESESVRTVA